MADKDQYNDEYQFADLDTVNPAASEGENQSPDDIPKTDTSYHFSDPTNIKRNALIVVVVVICIMLLYKFLGSYFTEKRDSDPMPAPARTAPVQTTSAPIPQVAKPVTSTPPIAVEPKVDQKLASIDLSQQNMRSEVTSISNQLTGISNSLNGLTAQLAQLNQLISTLNAKIEEQAHDIQQLKVRSKPKPVQKVVRRVIVTPKYYIQAVIPGRAWLIAQNGTTLTVREGTVIPGYGTVRLIDPNQGRITTSSGQVIRFSQADS